MLCCATIVFLEGLSISNWYTLLQEPDWSVLSLVLAKMTKQWQNKTLVLSADPTVVDNICQTLCNMVCFYPTCLLFCLYVCLYVHLFVCLSVCACLSGCLSTQTSVSNLTVRLFSATTLDSAGELSQLLHTCAYSGGVG